MRSFKCRQCGAEAHDAKTCVERLQELLLASHSAYARSECLEAVARFALQHPATFSDQSLELARRQIAAGQCSATTDSSAQLPGDEEPEPNPGPSGERRPLWHALARRLGCQLSRRILRGVH
jgi:hypothetical protein